MSEETPPAPGEELAAIDLKGLSGRQWSAIDCALCGGWLSLPRGTATRSLGDVTWRERRYTLWAHDPACPETPVPLVQAPVEQGGGGW